MPIQLTVPFLTSFHTISRHEAWKRLKSLKCSVALHSKSFMLSCDPVTEYSEAPVPLSS